MSADLKHDRYLKMTDVRIESEGQTRRVTFGFMVRELVVSEAEPSLLEVLQTEAVSPLSAFDHESGEMEAGEG